MNKNDKNKNEMKPKKLTLSRETLCTLNQDEVKAVLGGLPPQTSNSVNICCT